MPFPNLEAVPEQIRTHQGASLNLAQANKWAEIFDAIKVQGGVDSPAAVAWSQWTKLFRKEGDRWVKKESQLSTEELDNQGDNIYINKETFSKEAEIFAAGKWNGDDYTIEDLDNMVSNFNHFKDKLKIPLKLGHDKDQKLAQKDGLPSLGWIKELKRAGKKLVAKIEGIPRMIKDLIENGAYGRFSSEIIWNFRHEGNVFKRVLAGVALLGADMPAVSSISDIVGMFSLAPELAEQPKKIYGLDANYQEGGLEEMEIKELETKLQSEREEKKKLSQEKEELERKYAEAQKQLEKKAHENLTIETYAIIDEGIKAKKVAPAIREKLAAFVLAKEEEGVKKYSFKDGDATKEIKFNSNFELLKNIIGDMPEIIDTKVHSQNDDSKDKIKDDKPIEDVVKDTISGRIYSTDESLDKKAQDLIKKYEKEGNKLEYKTALALAQKGEV